MMDALEFFKARKRMCVATTCNSCKLYHVPRGGCCVAPDHETIEACEEAIAIVEQWAKEHPIKTRQSEFLKHYPGARIFSGCLYACPNDVFDNTNINCNKQTCMACKKEFWLAEVEN